MDPRDPIPPIQVKSVYWGLEHMERPIHTKYDIYAGIPTLNNTTKNYPHGSRGSTGSRTSHISEISILRSWAQRTSDSHQI